MVLQMLQLQPATRQMRGALGPSPIGRAIGRARAGARAIGAGAPGTAGAPARAAQTAGGGMTAGRGRRPGTAILHTCTASIV
eukprot:7402782-Alexandrium_andersonii.AAC.1